MSELSRISQEDFHRLQTQILDLRTANYALQEESIKYRTELMQLNVKCDTLEREHQKAQKTIEKSRKAKDVELLFAENEGLQKKLIAQEEDFRLQNQTLMQELGNLVRLNEQLEKELSILKNNRQPENPQRDSETSACSQSTECDLLTEEFNKTLAIEKELYTLVKAEKTKLASQLEIQEAESKKLQGMLNCKIDELQQELIKLQVVANKVPSLEEKSESLERENVKLQMELVCLQTELQTLKENHQKEVNDLEEEHKGKLSELEKGFADKENEWRIQLEISSAQRTEFEEAASRARQEAVDAVEDVRIAERRIATVTQDLRRQLRAERRRADKLQERLRDLVNDGGK